MHYERAIKGMVGPVAIEIPYWKCSETSIEDILFFCKMSKTKYYQQQPFVNRETLVSHIDSFMQFNIFI